MSTKEEIRERVRQIRESGQWVIRFPALVRLSEYLIRALLGCMLSGAEIFGTFAPFGLAFTAASGAGLEGFAALLGSCLGYVVFRGFVNALPYVAACVLTFSVYFAFYDVKLCRCTWFMPTVAALLEGVIGFVYLSDSLTGLPRWVYFATELLLVAAGGYIYRIALSPWDARREDEELTFRQTVSLFILGCTLLISLGEVTLPGGISAGCLLGAMACMLAAWKGGAPVGALVGVCTGLAMDLSLGRSPQYTMAYAFAALAAGVFRRQGRFFIALGYVLANAAMLLWSWESGVQLEILYEVFAASVLFMILPEGLIRRVSALLLSVGEEEAAKRERAQRQTRNQLQETAAAFHALYDGLRTSFRRVAQNPEDCSGVFHRAANRVCVLCALRDYCWQREYAATMNSLNDGLPDMVKRGRGLAEDFPLHFRTRCLNFPALLTAANEELTALRYRRQFQSRARESREAVCRQYGLFARCLDAAAGKLGEEPVRDPRREKRLEKHMAALGAEGTAAVWFDPMGHLSVEVLTKDGEGLKSDEEREAISHLLGVPLGDWEEEKQGDWVCLRCRQQEPLMAVAGVSARKKEGQSVSGDAGAWFKTEDGALYVLLCDGMGSGAEARKESDLAINLLEKFLRAGMEAEEALNTLNHALALRWEGEGGFTTVDLFRLDLYTGEAGFYKLGAAASYVRRGSAVGRVTGTALPAGLNGGDGKVDVTALRLNAGDSVVLISDGISTPEEDGWVRQLVAEYDGEDPKALAQKLMEESANRDGRMDDCTAVVLSIKERS